MESDCQVTIIIPVYNEAKTIAEVVKKVGAIDLKKQIIIVDDGSTDDTRMVLKSLQSKEIEIVLVGSNQGKGHAIRQAIPHAKGVATVIQDADLEYNPEAIPRLVRPILNNECDVVYGARFLVNRRYTYHTLTNLLITFWFNLFSGTRLNDMETGAKAFRTRLLQKLTLKSDRFGFEPEVTIRLHKMGIPIHEIEFPNYISRSHAEGKKIKFKDGVAAAWHTIRYRWFD